MHALQVFVLVVLLLVLGVQAQDVTLTADSKIGYVVIAILLGLAAIGMLIRVKDVYPLYCL
jgi:hypothetical protein